MILDLKNLFDKEKALLEQNSHHLKIERDDLIERLEAERKMSTQMLGALNSG